MRRKANSIVFVLTLAICAPALAQVDTPEPSPRCIIEQRIGLTQVTLDYSRPGMRGRKVFGDLVPFDQVWRTGANAVSSIETDGLILIGEQKLVPGKYAILTVPNARNWEVRFFKYQRNSWDYYKDREPLFAIFVPSVALSRSVETFTMSFGDLTMDSASLEIYWENTLISVPFALNTDEMVKRNIERFAANPTATLSSNYFYAARYYADQDYELEKAYEWIQEAIKLRKQEAYWMYRTKAQIEGKLGLVKEAIASYERSSELVAKIGNDVYVKNNNRAIKELKNGAEKTSEK